MKLFLKKILFGGKNGMVPYWIKNYPLYYWPVLNREKRLRRMLECASRRTDYDYMRERADHYCLLRETRPLPPEAHTIGEYKLNKSVRRRLRCYPDDTLGKTYFFDTYRTLRWFNPMLRWMHLFGDVVDALPYPTIVKTRTLLGDASNNVILKLDKNRHFTFVRDTIPMRDKEPRLLCRCSINDRPQRLTLFREYFGQPWCDLGEVTPNNVTNPEWRGNKMTLYAHLHYRYIACFEGNDVASNLKWVMSSNSLAVMSRPTCESWFMEGRLIPDYHYILVKDDLSDLKDRLDYYTEHPDEAEAIVRHAHEYVAQFFDEERENLIQLMVAQRYFERTGQLV